MDIVLMLFPYRRNMQMFQFVATILLAWSINGSKFDRLRRFKEHHGLKRNNKTRAYKPNRFRIAIRKQVLKTNFCTATICTKTDTCMAMYQYDISGSPKIETSACPTSVFYVV